METVSVYWFGWYQSAGSDKIWAVLEADGEYYACYGKRGTSEEDLKKLKFSHLGKYKSTAESKIYSKEKKGYVEADVTIYPGFLEHLEQEMFYEMLRGNI